MHAEFTPFVSRALDRAGSDLRLLLLALLEEDEGRAARWLSNAGASLPAVRAALQDGALEPAFAPERVFPTSTEFAVKTTGERAIAGDHLLIAIICQEPDVLKLMLAAGLDMSAIQLLSARDEETLELDEPLDLSTAPEQLDSARILDACGNRAREALRVVEDYARFALDDAFLVRELKTLRHDLTAALESAGPMPLLEARETLGDVGTTIATAAESRRESPLHVAQVNLKRLQEALRSLEEFSKTINSGLGAALEKIRYHSYTLERIILLGSKSRQRLADARLYLLLSGSTCAAALDYVIAEAAAGGVDMVQLREKELPDRELLERARQVRRWTREAGVLFIVNDRPDIARLADADGVHLGHNDLSVHAARRIIGPDALIGVSTHSIEQVRQAIRDGANYLGVGPVFPSRTKSFGEFPGLELGRQAAAETTLPWFALGGITAENVADVVSAGAKRVAVSSAICAADEPRAAAVAINSKLDQHDNQATDQRFE